MGGSWSATADLLSSSQSSSPQVAIGNNGTVIAVWEELLSGTSMIYAAVKSLSGTWQSKEGNWDTQCQ